ncbi:MAG: 2-C-methyl-D-erythritol 4-phosphate cytidylyltransferase [Betaproteobacteria bacterium]|jgi:2-C-methyl-D-erythritol 4-phosphate cytidylyltransferase|nr:2-C-methyl-D-erythritol 4-phosphate cytidylyltransferase [Betaproteobacteria bacterium]NBY17965.1 2-C-methyl-D-erythritol 4-phosphate cytidylyltransferase [Betaproteobacteria bacterium]
MVQPEPQTPTGPIRHVALIPAAGEGRRMGAAIPKQYLSLHGKSLLSHVVRAFQRAQRIDAIAVVVAAHDTEVEQHLGDSIGRRPLVLRVGGATRRDSVLNGLMALRDQPMALADHDRVLVHDAARPGIRPAQIDELIEQLEDDPTGGLLALPVVDTVKRVRDGRIVATEDRALLWLAQTPQLFPVGLLQQALERHPEVTDEARAIELEGWHPRVLPGTKGNLKVTVSEDLEWLSRSWEIR